jgi:hypothetical protein
VADDEARAGEDLARAWLQGKSEMSDDLALLVSGMTQPLDEMATAFIRMIGNAAKAAPKSKVRQTPAGAPAAPPNLAQAQPSPEAPPAPLIDFNEMMRRHRESEYARRLEELWRENSSSPVGGIMNFGRGARW